MARIQVRNRLRVNEPIQGVTIGLVRAALPPIVLTATTNAAGVATLNLTGQPNGAWLLMATPAQTTADVAGPTLTPAAGVDRVFRTLMAQVTITAGSFTAAAVPLAQAPNGTVAVASSPQLLIRLQPVWMRSPNSGTRAQAIESIIVHHTGGPAIGPAINEFIHGQTSAHYLIDTDGQIVKMVLDSRRANHAGVASWNGNTNVNDRTIGIEIVNATGAYPAAQYTALTGLLTALTQAHTTIVPWDVIGHSDVATNASGRLGRKSGDPGAEFEWSRVEALGLGMSAGAGALAATDYGGFFVTVATGALRLGDNDSKNRFGGAVRAAMTADIVLELQTDLQTIGYTVGTPDGDFGQKTHAAVEMFQEHFFAGGRGHKNPDGRVDAQTARLIKAAVAAHP